MAKKNQLKKHEEYFDVTPFDDEEYSNDMMTGIMSGMLDASNNQMMMAIELTKLIVGNSTIENREEHVFSVFKKAVKVVGENFALKNLMEQFGFER